MWTDTPRTQEFDGVDRTMFEAEVVSRHRPAILKGAVAEWAATRAGLESPRALCGYLGAFATPVPAQVWFGARQDKGRFGYNDNLRAFNFERRLTPIRDLLALLLRTHDDLDTPPIYAGGVPLSQHLPGLIAAAPMPLLDPDEDKLISLWIGNGSRTAAHWDLPQNLACVIAGTRRFVLFPPDQLKNLYSGPIDYTLAGQPISLVDFENPDFDAHPRFREAMRHAELAELAPGDALYIPSMWWHHVASPDRLGAQINFWWRDAPAHMATPLYSLFHAMTTIRDLPADERAAWRAFFDHYIFLTDGDPAAHIPEDRRGALGAMTPENVARLRGFLARTLGG